MTAERWNFFLSSQIDCWVSFMLVQIVHSGSIKLQIHPPGRLGVFHSYGGRSTKIILSHPKLTSESYCVLVQMSHPHPVELHVPPSTNSAGRPVALLFPSYNLSKKFRACTNEAPFMLVPPILYIHFFGNTGEKLDYNAGIDSYSYYTSPLRFIRTPQRLILGAGKMFPE